MKFKQQYNENKLRREIECLQRRYNKCYQKGYKQSYLDAILKDIELKNKLIAKPVYISIIPLKGTDEVGRPTLIGHILYGSATVYTEMKDGKAVRKYKAQFDPPKRIKYKKPINL